MKALGQIVLTALLSVLVYSQHAEAGNPDPFCWLRSESPTDAILPGPIRLDTEWKNFKLVKPLKAAPDIQYLEFYLEDAKYDFKDYNEDERFKQLSFARLPVDRHDEQVLLFEAKVHNSKAGWVSFAPSSNSWPKYRGEAYKALGYSINSDKDYALFPQDSVIDQIRIRANRKVEIPAIKWEASRYGLYPCRTWEDVDQSLIMPASDQAKNTESPRE